MVFIAFIISLISFFILRSKQDKQELSFWKDLFSALTLKVTNFYCKGTPTKVVMMFLRVILILYEGTAFTCPIIRASIGCSETNGFWKLFVQFQYDSVSRTTTYIFLGCSFVVVIVYLITYRYEDDIEKKLADLLSSTKRVEDHTARIESNTSEIKEDVSKLVYRLNGIGSNVVKHLLPDFQESINSLKVNTASKYLETLWKEIEISDKSNYALKASVRYMQGECAKFMKKSNSNTFHKQAYDLMKKSGEDDEDVLEGVIYEACKAGDNKSAVRFSQELIKISPNNPWVYIWDLINSKRLKDSIEKLPVDVNKDIALSYCIMLGGGNNNDLGIDIDTYEYHSLECISMDNFSLWIMDLSVAATRFCSTFLIQKDIKAMCTPNAKALYGLTDKFLSLLKKTEIENPLPDTIFLHAAIGYMLNQDSKWLKILETAKPSSNMEELYLITYALALNDANRYEDAKIMLRQNSGKNYISILNIRFVLATLNDDLQEWIDIFKCASDNKECIPDHLAHYFFASIYINYKSLEDIATNISFEDDLTNEAYSVFLTFVKDGNADTEFILQNKEHFSSTIASYMAIICKEKGMLSVAIEILERCVDKSVLDFRTLSLIEYYKLDKSFGQKLYHLLKDLRHAGQMNGHTLSLELSISIEAEDAENSLEVTSELIKMYPEDYRAWVNHVQSLFRCGGHEKEIADLKTKFENKELSVQVTIILFNLYHAINETKYALDLLYNEIIRTQNQELKDCFIAKHLNPDLNALISQNKDIVEYDDFVKLSIVGKSKECTITKGSVYEDLVGCKVGDKRVLKLKENTEVEILSINTKYFKLLRDIFKEIGDNQSSRTIKMFNIDDFDFRNNPLEALRKMTGQSEDFIAKEQALIEQYKKGGLPLLNFIDDNECISDTYEKIFGNFMVCSIPIDVYRNSLANNEDWKQKDIVLDITSLISLYEFDMKYGLNISKKFILPRAVAVIVRDQLLNEEKGCTRFFSKIVTDRVGVNIIDDAKTLLWNKLKGIEKWINVHCKIETVEEILNCEINNKDGMLLKTEMESVLLVTQRGMLLLSEDWSFGKRFMNVIPTLSTFNWLSLIGHDKVAAWGQFMLDCGNVGYPMTSAYIREQYDLMALNEPNSFAICMENIRYNVMAWESVIDAARGLVSGIIQPAKVMGATNMLAILFSCLDKERSLMIIQREKLMPITSIWYQCLIDALKISHPLLFPESSN